MLIIYFLLAVWVVVAVVLFVLAYVRYFKVGLMDFGRLSLLDPGKKKAIRWIATATGISLFLILVSYTFVEYLNLIYPFAFHGRAIGFIDSVFAGTVSFISLGAFTFYASMRRPEQESIDDRILYLYSAKIDGDQRAREYIKSKIMSLGAAATESSTEYKFTDVDYAKGLIKSNITVKMKIANMMMYDTYKQTLPLRIKLDPLQGREDCVGRILSIDTTSFCKDGVVVRKVSHVEHACSIPSSPYEYRLDLDLEIPPNGTLDYVYQFEAWTKINDNFWTGVNRYSAKHSVRITNVSPLELTVGKNLNAHGRVNYLDVDGARTVLPGTSQVIHEAEGMEPGHPLTFTVSSSYTECPPKSGVG